MSYVTEVKRFGPNLRAFRFTYGEIQFVINDYEAEQIVGELARLLNLEVARPAYGTPPAEPAAPAEVQDVAPETRELAAWRSRWARISELYRDGETP